MAADMSVSQIKLLVVACYWHMYAASSPTVFDLNPGKYVDAMVRDCKIEIGEDDLYLAKRALAKLWEKDDKEPLILRD